MPFSARSYRKPNRSTFGGPNSFISSQYYKLQKKSKVIIRHRGSNEAQLLVEAVLRPLGSRFVYLSYEEHDLVTANTQAVTHAAFLRYKLMP
jgi:prephenate dehydrogenase